MTSDAGYTAGSLSVCLCCNQKRSSPLLHEGPDIHSYRQVIPQRLMHSPCVIECCLVQLAATEDVDALLSAPHAVHRCPRLVFVEAVALVFTRRTRHLLDDLDTGLVRITCHRGLSQSCWLGVPGMVVIFAACTASRIGEVSGCRVQDIDTDEWIWTLRRQTSPGPGGLTDKGTKGKRARRIPIIENIRPMVLGRITASNGKADARLFVDPRNGRIQTGVLRRATRWPDVVAKLGYEHLRRHDLRHTGLTWFADAGVPLHRLQQIAGHTDPRITQRYLHPDIAALQNGGDLLSRFLTMANNGPQLPELPARMGQADWSPNGPQLRVVE
ncbi:site-specific integrase [Nocardia sp. NPDC051321]|uniref:site-specific integrase n=1 Tax=Nocardia sp. NPDC051321 TaxID=3364323 RepID=UPI003791A8B6